MDKFENMLQMMSKMTKEENMKTIETNKALCVCPSCPAYNECANEKGELFYLCIMRKPHMHHQRVWLHMPRMSNNLKDGSHKRILLHKRDRKAIKMK